MGSIIWDCKKLKRDKVTLDPCWMIGAGKINIFFVSSFSEIQIWDFLTMLTWKINKKDKI